ncbi:MAG: PKD domain-containing protein, partial [Gammaproteobacteria bacterium]|nr:PKD domain-containing protein [Gammaproteobacteria bacterium]
MSQSLLQHEVGMFLKLEFNRTLFLALSLFVLSSCGGGGGGGSAPTTPSVNIAPISDAGTNRSVATGLPTTLDASASSDANSDSLIYSWNLVSSPIGSTAVLSDPKLANPVFTPDLDGKYFFSLTVNDGETDGAISTIVITALTSADLSIHLDSISDVIYGSVIRLNYTITNNGNINAESFAVGFWPHLSASPGFDDISECTDIIDILNAGQSVTSSMDCPAAITTGTAYARVDVDDNIVEYDESNNVSDAVAWTATAPPTQPVANAGSDILVATNTLYSLDGSSSTIANGDTLSYQWSIVSQPDGSTASLINATLVNPNFTPDIDGQYVFSLVVSDALATSAPDTVTITATSNMDMPDFSIMLDSVSGNGSTIQFVYTIYNTGNVAAAPGMIFFWDNVVTDPTQTMPVCFTSVEDNIAANASLTQTFNCNSSITTGTAYAAVDVGSVFGQSDTAELNENNNISVAHAWSQGNFIPVANAGSNRTIVTGKLLALDGSASSDLNSDTLSYSWQFVSVPAGSALIDLTNAATVSPTFTPDIDGSYVISLVVNDGTSDSAPHLVTYTASINFPDLTISLDSVVGNGSAMQFAYTINNTGAVDIEIMEHGIELWADAASTPVMGVDISDCQIQASAGLITAGGSVTGFAECAHTATTGTAYAAVDTQLMYQELNEDNNVSAGFSWTGGNLVPTANAGSNRGIINGQLTSLDGSASADPDNDQLSYNWTLVSRPDISSTAALSDPAIVNPTFTPDFEGSYTFSLVVNDGAVDSAVSTVTLTTTTLPDLNVTLNSVTDMANGSTMQIAYTVTNSGNMMAEFFVAGFWLDLSAKPGMGDWSEYNVLVEMLDAGQSVSGTIEIPANSQAGGTAYALVDQEDMIYEFDENNNSSNAATWTINLLPKALAGNDYFVPTNTPVNLDGSSSFDPEGNSLTYLWTLVNQPGGSNASLSNTIIANPDFTPDLDGLYEFSLVVNDGTYNSTPLTVMVVADSNTPDFAITLHSASGNGSQLQFVYTIHNIGNGPGSLRSLVFWDDIASPPAIDNVGIPLCITYINDTLAAGASISGSFICESSATAGTAYVAVNADVLMMGENIEFSPYNNLSAGYVWTQGNIVPVANAGSNAYIVTGQSISLDGSASSDLDGETLTYNWQFESVPATSGLVNLTDATTVNASFTPDVDGEYVISLIVNDGTENSAPHFVTYTSSANFPDLSITLDAVVGNGSTTQFAYTISNTGARDIEPNYMISLWASASTVPVIGVDVSSCSLQVPLVTVVAGGSMSGFFECNISVTSGTAYAAVDVQQQYQELNEANNVSAGLNWVTGNMFPVANAGLDQYILTNNQLVVLDGTDSLDADGDTLSFS